MHRAVMSTTVIIIAIMTSVLICISCSATRQVTTAQNSTSKEYPISQDKDATNTVTGTIQMRITSTAFDNNQSIPSKYTCMGDDINPPIHIENAPKETVTFALIIDDPDAPIGVWTHWVMWNIPPETSDIKEKSVPQGVVQGKNSWGMQRYGGPCPPSGTHRYFFKLYALDSRVDLPATSNKRELEFAMQGKVLTSAELIGTYKKLE